MKNDAIIRKVEIDHVDDLVYSIVVKLEVPVDGLAETLKKVLDTFERSRQQKAPF